MDGQTLTQARQARGLTQEQLAAAATLSVSTVRRAEHDRVQPRRSTLTLLTLALNHTNFAGAGTGRRERDPAGATWSAPAGHAPTTEPDEKANA